MWQTEEILVLVKVYPTPSSKYGETVCTAGITKEGKWLRLYPIPYRILKPHQQFQKFQWIRARIQKSSEKLRRPESFKVDADSIELLKKINPGPVGWTERWAYLQPALSTSLEELNEKKKSQGTSLGMFRPKNVTDFVIENDNGSWSQKQEEILNRESFFDKKPPKLEKIPYKFRYTFTCSDPQCNGHNLIVLDWEAVESYRNFKRLYKDESLTLKKMKEKWLDYFFKQRESYFVVGTDSEFGNFMILTVISPRRLEDQLSLGI